MKKICFILALILILCGCSSAEPEGFGVPDVPSIIPGSGFQSEPAKIFLPLENLRESDFELPDSADIFGTRTEIPALLPENFSESDSNVFSATLWPELVAEIQKGLSRILIAQRSTTHMIYFALRNAIYFTTARFQTPAQINLLHVCKKVATEPTECMVNLAPNTKGCTADPKDLTAVVILP